MQTLLAVLIDLAQFLREHLFWRTAPSQSTAALQLPVPSPISLLPGPEVNVALKGAVAVVPPQSVGSDARLTAAADTKLYADPTVAFDNAVRAVPCGTPVFEGERTGRFLAVTLEGGERGFMLEETIAEARVVLPRLTRGHRYLAAAPETAAIRQYLGDAFGAGAAHLPLTPEEYVTYRLRQAGSSLPWPVAHGRIAGTWARKLRGTVGVHIGVEPRTGAVMEYIIDDVGFLAYVERVSPDLTLTVVGIGLTFEAQFTEQVLKERAWRELRPLFIAVR